MSATILLIEDDVSAASALKKALETEDYDVTTVHRGDHGLEVARQRPWDLVITDLRLPGLDGMELMAQLHALRPKQPIIMMTAHGTSETAIEATRLGAIEYLVKPFDADDLLALASSVIAKSRLVSEPVALGEARPAQPAIVGRSRVMQDVYKTIGRVAATPLSVLIRGATGTGKELIARAIYQHSDRADKPFIAVNCAAIPETLLESELFGHERGAFTGAHTRRIGRFEQAHGGTIFLDEIGDLSPGTQSKLLRVLQEKSIQRLGAPSVMKIDARVLAATHRDLEAAIEQKEFRQDLFFRLSVVTINVPPLSARIEDVPDLVNFFMNRYGRELGVEAPSFQPEAMAWLQKQSWPGNIRQLENVVRQALVLARPFPVGLEHVQRILAGTQTRGNLSDRPLPQHIAELLESAQRGEQEGIFARLLSDVERELYSQAIEAARGNQAKAARWLGVTRLKMHEKLHEFGLRRPDEQGPPSQSI